MGDPIILSVLDYEKWPQQITKNDFYIKDKVTKDTFSGYVARRPITAGEPITKKSIIDGKNQGALAALLNPGMRAIAINVDAASISGGLVMPGDIVDIIITYAQGMGADQHYISQTVLCEVRVLALDQRVASDNDSASVASNIAKKDPTTVPRTITLEITPEDVERLTAAVKKGTPSLSLHSSAAGKSKCHINFLQEPVKSEEPKDIGKQPPLPEAHKPEAVQIIRGSMGESSSLMSGGKN